MNELSRADIVLLAAAKRFSTRGYHGLSFRDLAKDVGITSASVHYHYPTKTDLVCAIAKYCSESMDMGRRRIEDDSTLSPSDKIGAYCDLVLEYSDDLQLCQCMASALVSIDSLPDPVADAFRKVVHNQLDWLEKICATIPGETNARMAAKSMVSRLLGLTIMRASIKEFEHTTALPHSVYGLAEKPSGSATE